MFHSWHIQTMFTQPLIQNRQVVVPNNTNDPSRLVAMRDVDACRDYRHDACELKNQLLAFAHACSTIGTQEKV